MTKANLKKHLSARSRQVTEISKNLHTFKVCEQCSSISRKTAGLCPVCHAYRFEEDVSRVEAVLAEIAKYPFPVNTLGYPPRLKSEAETMPYTMALPPVSVSE
jgi:hypothetical protein